MGASNDKDMGSKTRSRGRRERDLRELIELSRFYGQNPDFVLAGGGNTSYKDDETLFIKASGVSLAGITPDGFVGVNRGKLNEIWEKQYSESSEDSDFQILQDILESCEKGEENKRPSVETLLHSLFPFAYVVHTHHCLINGMTCAQRGEEGARALFGDRVLWVPITKPGYTAAKRVREDIGSYSERFGSAPRVVVLQNHGVFVAGESFEEIRKQTDSLVETLRSEISVEPDVTPVDPDRETAASLAPALRMLLMGDADSSIIVFKVNREILKLVESRDAFAPVSSAFTPDHIVYYGHPPLFISIHDKLSTNDEPLPRDKLQPGDEPPHRDNLEGFLQISEREIGAYRRKHGDVPRIVAIQGLGVFAWGGSKAEADTALALFEDAVKVSVYTRSFGGPLFMPPDLIAFIKSWEAEHYRQKVAAADRGNTRMGGKVAIVTGGAQGIGLAIAEALVREGANVIVADINSAAAEEQARRLCEMHGGCKAQAVTVDVGTEESVRSLMWETALRFGGLDLLVSNAGVLKAGGLEDMNLASFELVTQINYTAFFLCVKYGSEIMKLQHRLNADFMMDIVQINSKSGLKGSSRNFAYAGSKFGGLGLTQSFALELVEYNIKVNAICPGNYFDGPLWSDPEKGLFVQYLKAGKVPGAKNAGDVRRYYESQVPMGRGCETKDIERALFYILEQQYETGQAVPVTGGQIMLG